MKKITVEFIMSHSPCEGYPKSRVTKLIGSGKTPLQILALKIKPQDRIWVMTRSGVLTHAELVEFAIDCAERALPEFEKRYPKDNRPREAIDATKAWLKDPTYAAANAAANAAAYAANAANAAAYTAANAANAAYTAAYAAAYAAYAAAYAAYAAYAAAYAANATYAAAYAANAANAAANAAYAAANAANAAYANAAYAAANAANAAAEYDHQIEFLSNIIKRRAR